MGRWTLLLDRFMSEFPNNPSDVSSQMGPSLADKLNDAGIGVGTHHPSPNSTEVTLLRSWGDRPVEPSTGISTAGDTWVAEPDPRDPFGAYEYISLDEFGIKNIEAIRNSDIEDAFAVEAWNIIVSGLAGRAVWRERGRGITWSGEWSDV